MASAEFQFDTRIRRYHVPLKTQQRRLRHLRSVSARNVVFCHDDGEHSSSIGLSYTLHCHPKSDAFYTSEVISGSLNPTWKEFEPSNFPESTTSSLPYVTVKMWNSVGKLIIEWIIFFSGLHFLGKQIPKEGKNFKPNTLVFGMLEGYYGCNECQEHWQEGTTNIPHKDSVPAEAGGLRTSCAFSTLGRITMFEKVIGQIQATASKLKQSIKVELQKSEELHEIHVAREFLKIKVSMLQVEVQRQKCHFTTLEKQVLTMQQVLVSDRQTLKAMCEELQKMKENLMKMWRSFWEFRENLLKTEAQLVFRRKELVSDLCFIYPIVQFPDHKGYSIHNVHLPNSENLTGHDQMMISVALGYVCHVLLMVSQFLNVPLRYELHFNGSKSVVVDLISSSIPVKNREFPLYAKGKDKRYFEYAVYLLNKNIAQLRTLFGMTSKELSATLPNLHGLVHQKLSFLNEAGLPITPSTVSDMQEGIKSVSQNGLSHSLSNIPHKILEHSSSEIEHLRKEMAEMMPFVASNNSETNNLVKSWTSEMPSMFRGSLDKGLNDMKVLESTSDVFMPKNQDMLATKQIGQAFHHSSYPNLNSTVPLKENFSETVPDSPQLQGTPLRMWTAASSHTNSEEEQNEESLSAAAGGKDKNKRRNTQFYVPQEWTVIQNDGNSSTEVSLESVMLAEEDFSDDLTLRAEQLANRSSSFRLQRISNSNADSQLHPT